MENKKACVTNEIVKMGVLNYLEFHFNKVNPMLQCCGSLIGLHLDVKETFVANIWVFELVFKFFFQEWFSWTNT